MTPSNTRSSFSSRSFFPGMQSALTAGLGVAVLVMSWQVQAQTPAADPAAASAPATASPAIQTDGQPPVPATLSNLPAKKDRKQKEDKVVQSKDTKQADKRYKKVNPLEGVAANLPDKQLYDKALDAVKHGRYDVARLDLQTLLNTYPDSQFQMRSKLAIADSWYREGGTAALTQAEQEYRDFITFFPNVPEAAEAQMRIGDIYFKEMDKPDRDNSKAVHAEQEYRLMLQQFPDSPRVPEAAQRLREVQEQLASAESDVAAFYASRLNWAAAIARYQTVADQYPLYSHMDDVLVGLGDAYSAEAKIYRSMNLPEAAKAQLQKIYDDQAAAAYRKVVLEHSAAPHVEDARDRLDAMGLPIPTPTPEQAAASAALENSRGQYTLANRATVLILHRADTVPAATKGDPPLEDAQKTYAPDIVRKGITDFYAAVNPAANKAPASPASSSGAAANSGTPSAAPTPAAPAAPLSLQDVPAAGGGPAVNSAVSPAAAPESIPASGGGNGLGVEIVQPTGNTPAPAVAPGAPPPAFPGTAAPAASSEPMGGIGPVGPPNSTPLPAAEKATAAPDPVNDVNPAVTPPAQPGTGGRKTPKPAFDKSDESSSKHKKKKGLAKINPF